MSDNALPDWVKPGAVYRVGDRKYHVRGIVDGMAVVRYWRRAKQRWEYSVEDDTYFAVYGDRVVVEKAVDVVLDPAPGTVMHTPFATAERLKVGDQVSLNADGKLQKAVPGQHHLGVLPPGTIFGEGFVQVPEDWFRLNASTEVLHNIKVAIL